MPRKKALSEEEQQKRLAIEMMELLTSPQFDKEGKERQRLKDMGMIGDYEDPNQDPDTKARKEKKKYEESDW